MTTSPAPQAGPSSRRAAFMGAAVVALCLLTIVGQAPRAAADPVADDPPGRNRILIETVTNAQGPVTRVRLVGWPSGPVTVSVCGNNGVRASQDCDLIGARTAGIETDKAVAVVVRMTPPVGCPCVVRVATKDATLVRQIPIELPGVPTLGPDERPPDPFAAAPAAQLQITATVEADDALGARLREWVAGPVDRTAVVTMRNTSGFPVSGLVMTAATGRDAASGVPVPVPTIGTLAEGEQRVVRVPFAVGAPSAGESVFSGTVIGLERPIPFEAPTVVRPWALYVLAAAILVLVLGRRRRRHGKRNRRAAAGLGDARDDRDDPVALRAEDGATEPTRPKVSTMQMPGKHRRTIERRHPQPGFRSGG